MTDYEVNGTKLNINGKTHDFKHHINDIKKVNKWVVYGYSYKRIRYIKK